METYEWTWLAAAQGHKDAAILRAPLDAELKEEQILEGIRRARRSRPEKPDLEPGEVQPESGSGRSK